MPGADDGQSARLSEAMGCPAIHGSRGGSAAVHGLAPYGGHRGARQRRRHGACLSRATLPPHISDSAIGHYLVFPSYSDPVITRMDVGRH